MVVIIPAYEPDEQLFKLVSDLHENPDSAEYKIVVVDDGSNVDKENLFDRVSEYAVVLKHPSNYGKGRAMKTAMRYVLEQLPYEDGIVTVDADGQHKPKDVISICRCLIHNPDKLILGVRDLNGKVPPRSKIGNAITCGVFALTSGTKLSDTQTGLRAFGTHLIPFMLEVEGDRYEYEMNMLLRCAEDKIRWQEVPIATVYLTEKNTSSHFNAVQDSFRIYIAILKFSGTSLLSFLLDYTLFHVFLLLMSGAQTATAILLSNILARVISSVFNYQLNRCYVFQSKGKEVKTASQYFTLAIGILLVNSLLMELFTAVGIAAFVAKILTEILLFLISMLVQHFIIFKSKEN